MTKQVNEKLELENYSSYGLKELIDVFNTFLTANQLDDARFYIEIDTGYGGSYDSPSIEAKLYGERAKTKEEIDNEIKELEERDELNKQQKKEQDKKLKLQKEERDRKEFERLKKKYGDK